MTCLPYLMLINILTKNWDLRKNLNFNFNLVQKNIILFNRHKNQLECTKY